MISLTLLLLAATMGAVVYAVHIWEHPPAHARRGPLYLIFVGLAVSSLVGAVVLARTAPEGLGGVWEIVLAGMLFWFVTIPAVLMVLVAEVRVRSVRRRDRS